MKALFITNFYPPVSRGGYEQWCQEVADGLRNKGHEVYVLTSRYQIHNLLLSDPDWVMRDLHLEMEFASLRNALQFFTSRRNRQKYNLKLLQSLIQQLSPDVILIWGMWNLHLSLPELAEVLMPGRVIYYIGDYWPTLPDQFENYWQAPSRNIVTGIPKFFLKPLAQKILISEKRAELKFEHVIFPTQFMQNELMQRGVTPGRMEVVYGAIDTNPYTMFDKNGYEEKNMNSDISLLYVGRLTREKGVHTAIQALGHLKRKLPAVNVRLTVVGSGESNYEMYLRQIAKQHDVESLVTFMTTQPKETLPSLYHKADIFLFTSIWPEPFGRVIVEAMASGVVVIGTAVGGAAEILKDGVNALTFSPDDPTDLAQQVVRLIESPVLRVQLVRSGRETALAYFDMRHMTDGIENYLQVVLEK